MSQRPVVVLAMTPIFTASMWTAERWNRLCELCEVPDRVPLLTFEEPRAADLMRRAELLLTGWGCPVVDTKVLDAAPRLRAIVHAAGTVKLHLTEDCWARGLLVTAAAAANARPVAEYTLAAILFANKKVFRLQHAYRESRAFQFWPAVAPGLGNFHKRVGIVGASQIGRRVIELLKPFDLTVQVYDPYLSEEEARVLGVTSTELDDLLATSDVVSLHAPALPDTHHMIDARRLARMRDGTTLINTARGWLVDCDALTAELRSGRIDAIIDTTEPEVLPADSPLYELPNVLLTPHIAGAMGDETQRMADLALDEIERFTRGEPFLHTIRHEDLARIA